MELSANQIQKVMDINVMGVHRCVKAFFGCMQRGSIVVPILSEIAYAMQSSAFNAAYSMSKFALQAYVIALRQELSLVGVQVKGVYPGAIATKLSMNHTTDMTIQHIENNKTLFKNPLLQRTPEGAGDLSLGFLVFRGVVPTWPTIAESGPRWIPFK